MEKCTRCGKPLGEGINEPVILELSNTDGHYTIRRFHRVMYHRVDSPSG